MKLSSLMNERNILGRDVAKFVGISAAYVTKLVKGEEIPPSPENTKRTHLYQKLNKLFNLPDGSLEALAMEDRHGKARLNEYAAKLAALEGDLTKGLGLEDEEACRRFLTLDEDGKKAVRNMIDALFGRRNYDSPEVKEMEGKVKKSG